MNSVLRFHSFIAPIALLPTLVACGSSDDETGKVDEAAVIGERSPQRAAGGQDPP